jgi:uncharacterized protein (DUF1697 family)
MADLRAVVTSLAHTDVATYIQSGNVVFSSVETDTATIAAALERVLSRQELSQVGADNPYPDEGSRDEATIVGRTVFLHTPDGVGRSELAAQLARTGGPLAPGGSATMPNWATVTRLLAVRRP